MPVSQRALSYSQMRQARSERSQRVQSSGGVMGPLRRERSGDARGSGGSMRPPRRDGSGGAGTNGGAGGGVGIASSQSGI